MQWSYQKKKQIFFFPHFCASISQKRQSRGNTTRKYFHKYSRGLKNEFVPAMFASLKQTSNSVMVTHILTERKLWKLMRIDGKQSIHREGNQPDRSQTALITTSTSNTYNYSWEYQRELQQHLVQDFKHVELCLGQTLSQTQQVSRNITFYDYLQL